MSEEKDPIERPLECSECRRAAVVFYTVVVGNHVTKLHMCKECPYLEGHLFHGDAEEESGTPSESTGLVCGDCGTSLDEVRRGGQLGCSHCYQVFADVIRRDLAVSGLIPEQYIQKRGAVPLHVGRRPGETAHISPSLRLMALNQALSATIKSEDYEQAAWLRDQIKKLTEKSSEEGRK